MSDRKRYVIRGEPGGYRIWDTKANQPWGDHYELCPDEFLAELNYEWEALRDKEKREVEEALESEE